MNPNTGTRLSPIASTANFILTKSQVSRRRGPFFFRSTIVSSSHAQLGNFAKLYRLQNM